MNRAYSLLDIKAVKDDQRIIVGVATTPTPDRVGDIVEPLGVKFKNPMPLLWQHRSDQPVGTVRFDKPSKDGITFEARMPHIAEPGPLKDRVDTAWGEVQAGLVRGVSIGFRSLEASMLNDGGMRFIETEVLELSLVTIPANQEATITAIKSLDEIQAAIAKSEIGTFDKPPAAPGTRKPVVLIPPGASGPCKSQIPKVPKMATLSEQIAALENTRAAKAARMQEVMQKSIDEGRSTDDAEREEFDTLEGEVEALDADLKRLRVLEKHAKATAKPVEGVKDSRSGSDIRLPASVKTTAKVEPGIRFARVAKCIGMAKGNLMHAEQIAVARYKDDDAVINILKAAVAAGTTSDTTWAGNLIGDETSVFADFIEFLRPQTILGRFGTNGIPSLRRVPFRVPLVGQTSGGDGYWVGEGLPKPLTKFDFSRTTLEPLKVANIAVLTEEVLRDSSPSAETIVRDQLAAALRARLDTDFIDPAKSASAGVSPASVTNGVSPISSDGNDAESIRTDIRAMFGAFIAANNAPTSGVWVMPATVALALSLMQNPLGQAEFPGISMSGGTLFGLPVIVSEFVPTVTAGAYVVLLNAQDIYLADEGGIMIDMSREASLQMNDAPTTQDATTGTGTSLVSLWQTNTVGFRAERTINWAKRRSEAVQLLSAVNWGEGGS